MEMLGEIWADISEKGVMAPAPCWCSKGKDCKDRDHERSPLISHIRNQVGLYQLYTQELASEIGRPHLFDGMVAWTMKQRIETNLYFVRQESRKLKKEAAEKRKLLAERVGAGALSLVDSMSGALSEAKEG